MQYSQFQKENSPYKENSIFFDYVQRYFVNVVTIVLQFLFIALIIRFFIISRAEVNGQSMENTLKDSDVLLVDQLSYLVTRPKRFDIVRAIHPEKEDTYIVKRIVGLPGERLLLKGKKVFLVNEGESLEIIEPYAVYEQDISIVEEPFEVEIPENQYFVMGDNRGYSIDSRNYGPLHRRLISGKVAFVNTGFINQLK